LKFFSSGTVEVDHSGFDSSGSEVFDPVAKVDVSTSLFSVWSWNFKVHGQVSVTENEAINRFFGQILFAVLPNPLVLTIADLTIQMALSGSAVAR
jgi:hypothetical protein